MSDMNISHIVKETLSPAVQDIAQAIRDCLISPNESDQNLEPANVVDALAAIARAISRLAEAVEKMEKP